MQPTLQGHVDRISEQIICGWAHDSSTPNTSVEVTIHVRGRPVAFILAAAFRSDLKEAGMGDGRKAFSFDPSSYIKTETDDVRVAFSRSGETLPGGRGLLALSRARLVENWDCMLKPQDARTAIERLQSVPRENWPTFSVIVPNYNTPAQFIELAVRSVLAQTYPFWELCIADNKSTVPEVIAYLTGLVGTDPRIKIKFREFNGGISASTNSALELATGSYCALLDADDELTPDALAEVAAQLVASPEIDVLYTDQDKIDETGRRFESFHKPAWSPVFFLGVMYVGHLLVARTSLLSEIGGCDSTHDKVQDYELMLRLAERTSAIAHLPVIAYHWRTLPGSLASSNNAKSDIGILQVAAVNAHLKRRGLLLHAAPHPLLPHRVQLFPQSGQSEPRVSIIIPTKNAAEHLRKCLDSIFKRTTYRNFEVIVVDTGTTDENALAVQRDYPICRLEDTRPFNFSRVNNFAGKGATGEILVFLNNDTEVITPDWLQLFLAHLSIPGVGAVGPLLLYPDNSVQHAGIVLGFRGTADHVMRSFDPHSDGYAGSLACAREVSAVTAACLMIRKDDYFAIGGMHEGFGTIYQDLDLCLKLREQGRSILYVPHAVLYHHESVSRGGDYDWIDREVIRDRWATMLAAGDPYYNPHFTRNRHDYSLRTTCT